MEIDLFSNFLFIDHNNPWKGHTWQKIKWVISSYFVTYRNKIKNVVTILVWKIKKYRDWMHEKSHVRFRRRWEWEPSYCKNKSFATNFYKTGRSSTPFLSAFCISRWYLHSLITFCKKSMYTYLTISIQICHTLRGHSQTTLTRRGM